MPGGGNRGGPAPGGIDAQLNLSGAAGDAGGYMQDPVAERLDFTARQVGVIGEADEFSPGHQIGCSHDDFKPSGVGGKGVKRQVTRLRTI